MADKLINILTSFRQPKEVCAIGNEAAARGALEAGVNGVFSYPGTPSTEISEIFNLVNRFQHVPENQKKHPGLTSHPIYFEYSINEKIAMEKAIAFSIGNKSALCVMKNVGMNVASDPLMSVTYQTIIAPLVIIVCDDPGCHSSSNEQDSRYWGQMASVPVFNPATSEDAYLMTKDAFLLSAQLRLPVIVRLTTRVSHTRGMLHYNQIQVQDNTASFQRMAEHINIPARTAIAHQKLLDKLKSDTLNPFFTKHITSTIPSDAHQAIVCSGVTHAYVKELLKKSNLQTSIAVLTVGLIYPFPEKEVVIFIRQLYSQKKARILIVEELDPVIENAVRTIAQKNALDCEILGKGYSGFSSTGEYSLDMVRNALEQFTGEKLNNNGKNPLTGFSELTQMLPPRPPALCAGCPHRATFYVLKLVLTRGTAPAVNTATEAILCGDIGCFGLGGLPPLKMIDTINHMGMSISMAQGLSEAFKKGTAKVKTIALLGDGTFFHSGITSLLNAVYTRTNLLVIIFDNRTIGMTGHQEHPGANRHNKYSNIAIPPLLKGMGVPYVETINPFNVRDSFAKIEKAMEMEGVAALVSQSPCIFLPEYDNSCSTVDHVYKRKKITIDPSRCNTCHNHADLNISCSRQANPQSSIIRARAKIKAAISIAGEKQLCPANICNHGFFNSILEKDYKTALEMVRDKMLFARTCGNICHRPCELFVGKENNSVPIKKLKNYVSAIEDNFSDFSSISKRIAKAEKKNKHIGIVGAGPAGLSAAYDLIQCGYTVTLIEKEQKAGGLIRYAIPGFRMDKEGFDYEVSQLEKLGVNFQFNTCLGKNISLNQLAKQYDAVLLSIGLGIPKKLNVIETNVPIEKKYDAISFLKDFNQGNTSLLPSSAVLVIGGGNSAIDAARAVKHLDTTHNVIVSCIETKNEMPAFTEEIIHAEKEGIQFVCESYVKDCTLDEQGKICINLYNYTSQTSILSVKANYVITAIGQTGEKEVYNELSNSIGEEEKIRQISSFLNVFVAGDISEGSHQSIIGAIASGKKAVITIRQLLENYTYPYEGEAALSQLNKTTSYSFVSKTSEKGNITEIVEQFNLFQACQKCNHCIENFGCPALIKINGKVTIDDSKCTYCGLCIDVCPNNAIRWVDVDV